MKKIKTLFVNLKWLCNNRISKQGMITGELTLKGNDLVAVLNRGGGSKGRLA